MSIREFPGVKIFLISLVWSLVSVGLVVLEKDMFLTLDTLFLFLARFSFVIAITIPFDIRDLKHDHLSMKTIPQIYGEQKAKKIALLSLAVFESVSIIHYLTGGFSLPILIALLMSSIFTAILVFKTSQEKNTFFFSFWVDGASVLMLLLLFVIPLAFGILVP